MMDERRKEKEIAELRSQMADMADRLKTLTSGAIDDAASAGDSALASASKWMGETAEQTRERARIAAEKAKEASRKASEYAQENPWQVAAAAAALGAVIGMLVSGKRR